MDASTFLALLAFAVVSSMTPGPNNLMIMASGANFGVRRSLPHLAGIVIGFSLMIVIVGLGLYGLFHAWPPSFTLLKVVSIVYTLWLAWKIARAGAPQDGGRASRPFGFVQAVGFQWVNAKAWTMGLTAITLYAPGGKLTAVLLIALVMGVMSMVSTTSWMLMGLSIRRWLSSPGRLRLFNYGMAALLVGSIALAV